MFWTTALLQLTKYVGARRTQLLLANRFHQPILHLGDIHFGRRQPLFAFQDDILVADLDHRRYLACLHGKCRILDRALADEMMDRLNQPPGACTVGIDRIFTGQDRKLAWLGGCPLQHFASDLRIFHDDHPDLDRFAILALEGLLDFVRGGLYPIGCHFPQRQCRPNDVGGILLGRNVSLLLQHLDPLVGRNIEFPRHPLDLLVHLLLGHGHVHLLTILEDQILVDHRFQNVFAVMIETFLSQLLPADVFEIDGCHDLRLLRCAEAGAGAGFAAAAGLEPLIQRTAKQIASTATPASAAAIRRFHLSVRTLFAQHPCWTSPCSPSRKPKSGRKRAICRTPSGPVPLYPRAGEV